MESLFDVAAAVSRAEVILRDKPTAARPDGRPLAIVVRDFDGRGGPLAFAAGLRGEPLSGALRYFEYDWGLNKQ